MEEEEGWARTGSWCGRRNLDEADDVGEELGDARHGVGGQHAQRRHVAEEVALEAPRHGRRAVHVGPPVRRGAANYLVVDVGDPHHLETRLVGPQYRGAYCV